MTYAPPSLDELTDFLVALSRSLLPEYDHSETGFIYKFLRSNAGGATDNHANIASVRRDLLPDLAKDEGLIRWANLLGVVIRSATPASKSLALRVYGSTGGAVTIGDQLISSGGLLYEAASAGSITGAATYVDVDVTSIDVGKATRLKAGEVLRFLSTPALLEEAADLVLDLDEGGEDEEQSGELRSRVINRLAEPPLGGAANDYVQWAKDVSGIATAYCFPARSGLGSVDLVALKTGSGSARVLTPTQKSAVEDYVNDQRPVGVDFRILDITTVPVDVEIAVIPSYGRAYAFDWEDATPLLVSSWTSATRTLQFTTDRPDSMKVGARIILKPVSGSGTGQQYVVEAFGAGADEVILEEEPSVAPVATDEVFSGGPLVDIARDALVAHLSGVTVYNSSTGPVPADTLTGEPNLPILVQGIGPANPDGLYGDWIGDLRLGNLYKLALVPGVQDLTFVTPTANVVADDPLFPDDDAIELIVPGRVIVRRGY